MAIYYRLDKKTDNLNPEDKKKTGLYPRVISKGTIGTRELCKSEAKGTTYNERELDGALKLLTDGIRSYLANGHDVHIEGLGTFSTTAEATRPAQQQDDIRAESVRTKRIVFKAARELLDEARTWKFERFPAK